VAKKKVTAERKAKARVNAAAAQQKLRDRVTMAASVVAAAKADAATAKKRLENLVKMAERKEAAVARFVESWTKKEMAKIEKALKPKRRKAR